MLQCLHMDYKVKDDIMRSSEESGDGFSVFTRASSVHRSSRSLLRARTWGLLGFHRSDMAYLSAAAARKSCARLRSAALTARDMSDNATPQL